MRLLCATTNPGKVREFRRSAEHFGAAIDLDVLPGLAAIVPPEETGATFAENAAIKAVSYSKHTDELLFCDDSGLEVDALGGEPGVHSARYAGPHCTDRDNNALLLERIRGKANRAARFRCVLALARRGELIATFDGVVEGEIIDDERGDGGFGYDPLFFHPPFGCTLAEATAEQKMNVSHRGQALEKMFRTLSASSRS